MDSWTSANAPVKNYPIKCHLCEKFFWRWTLQAHFEHAHPEKPFPQEKIVKDYEYEILKLCTPKLHICPDDKELLENTYDVCFVSILLLPKSIFLSSGCENT